MFIQNKSNLVNDTSFYEDIYFKLSFPDQIKKSLEMNNIELSTSIDKEFILTCTEDVFDKVDRISRTEIRTVIEKLINNISENNYAEVNKELDNSPVIFQDYIYNMVESWIGSKRGLGSNFGKLAMTRNKALPEVYHVSQENALDILLEISKIFSNLDEF